MATRSTIKVEGIDYVKVYKHWDGYPDNMVSWLEKFNKEFTDNRGDDPSYKIAQLLRHSTKQSDLSGEPYTGWGLVEPDTTMGAEFEYTLCADGTVKVKDLYKEL